ncbi:diguanylate cyclase [Niveispirillum sp. KHB5.9]|uniref:GGDEF domain-containing protein n=1 Tax=Niveispirillum sp. KHB5.9 TaxID=3400269 RepID=UPI003A89538F
MLPALDLASLFLSNAIITGVAAAVLAIIRRHHPDLKGIGSWAVGQAAYAIAFLMLYVSMTDPFQRAALPGFFCTFAGTLVTSLGFHRFLGVRRRVTGMAIAAFLLVVAGLSALSFMRGTPGYIMALTVATHAGVAGVNAVLLHRHGRGHLRPAALTLAAQYGVWLLFAVARVLYIATTGFDLKAAIDLMGPTMLVATLMLTCHALGLVWMVVGRLQEHLVQQAATDPLTGALNRRALQARLEQERARAARDGAGFALATFDLDHFKQLNDTHGHVVGDATLVGVVEAARLLLRPGEDVARLGGEEFCVLLPGMTGHDAVAMAERIRAAVARLDIASAEGPVSVAASFGVAWYGAHGNDWPTLLKAADSALYCAKRNGRNRVEAALA